MFTYELCTKLPKGVLCDLMLYENVYAMNGLLVLLVLKIPRFSFTILMFFIPRDGHALEHHLVWL